METLKWLKENKIQDVTERVEEVKKGCAFFAVKGTKVDGADFIPEAVKRGAVAIVADHEIKASVPVRVVPDVRRELALACSILWPSDKIKKVAVTGTNGKTSTVYFVQQLMNVCGIKAVSLGTIGMDGALGHTEGGMTTLPPKELAKTLAKCQDEGVQVVAMEASSHGLDQGRLVGQKLMAGAFTNLTRDHLDYHETFEKYFAAKQNLFGEILTASDFAVLNADIPEYPQLKGLAEKKGLQIISYGKCGETLRLVKWDPWEKGQKIMIAVAGKKSTIEVPVFGEFQAMNILAALGLCFALGVDWADLLKALPHLKAPAGRLELIGQTGTGGLVFVDYAHTPDALEKVFKAIGEVKGRVIAVHGGAGRRDETTRAERGEILGKNSDIVIITEDDSRDENPEKIAAQFVEGAERAGKTKGKDLAVNLDREDAIALAVKLARRGDVVLLLGKGHEKTILRKDGAHEFEDVKVAQKYLRRKVKELEMQREAAEKARKLREEVARKEAERKRREEDKYGNIVE